MYLLRSLQYGPMAYRAFPPLYNQALAHLTGGKYEEALEIVTQARRLAEAWGGNRTRMLVACRVLSAYLPALKADWAAAQAEVELAQKELNPAAPATQHVEVWSVSAMVAASRGDESTARELANRAIEKAPASEDIDESDLVVARILAKPGSTWCGALRATAADQRIHDWTSGAHLELTVLDTALGSACPGPRFVPVAPPTDVVLDKEIAHLEQAISAYLATP